MKVRPGFIVVIGLLLGSVMSTMLSFGLYADNARNKSVYSTNTYVAWQYLARATGNHLMSKRMHRMLIRHGNHSAVASGFCKGEEDNLKEAFKYVHADEARGHKFNRHNLVRFYVLSYAWQEKNVPDFFERL